MFDRMQTNDEKEKNEMNPTDVSDAKENNKSKKVPKNRQKKRKRDHEPTNGMRQGMWRFGRRNQKKNK